MSRSIRRAMIDRDHQQLSLVRQCILLDVSRASVYYRPVPTRAEDLELMALMDRQYLKTPFYGSRKMKAWLLQQGYLVSRKRVRRLMRLMGLEAIYRRPNTSKPASGTPDLSLSAEGSGGLIGSTRSGPRTSPTSPWRRASCTWWPSWTGTAGTCWPGSSPTPWTPASAWRRWRKPWVRDDRRYSTPTQGSQFTSEAFTQTLQEQRVQVSMDGKGMVPGQHLRGAGGGGASSTRKCI